MIQKTLIPILCLAALVGCGKNSSSEPTTPTEKPVASTSPLCSAWLQESSDQPSLSSCELSLQDHSESLHSEITKILPTKNGYFTLQNLLINNNDPAEKVGLNAAIDKLKDEYRVVYFDKVSGQSQEILRVASRIYDAEVYRGRLYVLFKDKSFLKLMTYRLGGEKKEFLISMGHFKKQDCRRLKYDKPCLADAAKQNPELLAKFKETQGYVTAGHPEFDIHGYQTSAADLAINKKTGEVFVYAEEVFNLKGNIYILKEMPNQFVVKKRTTIFENYGSLYPVPIGLTGGTELFGFLRFSREIKRHLEVLSTGEAVVTYMTIPRRHYFDDKVNFSNFKTLEKVMQLPFDKMTSTASPDLTEDDIRQAYTVHYFVAKISPSGKLLYHKAAAVVGGGYDSPHSPMREADGVGYVTISRLVGSDANTSLYKTKLLQWDVKQGVPIREVDLPVYSKGVAEVTLATQLSPSGDRIYMTGNSGFTQNPNGMSLYTPGMAFLLSFDLNTQDSKVQYYRLSDRKDYGSSLALQDDKLLLGVGYKGPLTHSGDDDIREGYQSSGIVEIILNP
ncbi:MAG: hypothetical protein KDD33_05360 [Bdellovibrionales bacterium]|nr:hypothetical protein [Bdellovibrionales bacterium]